MSYTEMLLKPGENIKPIVNFETCRNILEQLYGMKCVSIDELDGYDDKNFKVLVKESVVKNNYVLKICPNGYVLKIMNTLDSKKISFVEAQNDLMLYLCENAIACPKPIKNSKGQYYSTEKLISGEHVIRLLEFLPGSVLQQVPTCSRLFYQCGKFAAKLDSVLKNFHHDAYETHKTVWMLDAVPQLSNFLFAITDMKKMQIIEEVIQEFNIRVISVCDHLEKGMIHGDFNEQNIVVEKINDEWHLKGILDFGDSNYSCYLFEVSIVITYMILLAKDLDVAGYVIAGYARVRNITDLEFSLIKVCVAARLCQSLVMGAYSILQDPKNSYVLKTAQVGWDILTKLWYEPEDIILKRWKSIAKVYEHVE